MAWRKGKQANPGRPWKPGQSGNPRGRPKAAERALVRDFIARCLESLGYEVAGLVASAKEAVAQVRSFRPDLVLMDIVLDGRPEGIDAAARIRADSGVPVIFLTGKDDEETIRRATQAEPMAYLLKPFTAADLRAAIEVALRLDRAQRERQADARLVLAETISAVLRGSPASSPSTVRVRPAARQDSEPGSDPLRESELRTYSPQGETLWTADGIQAVQSPGDGSIRLQGNLRELLSRIKD